LLVAPKFHDRRYGATLASASPRHLAPHQILAYLDPVPLPLPEYDSLDGLALAQLVREGAVSPLELVEAAIARIEARNPRLNAVILTLYDRARDQAKSPLPDGPFKGVPFLLKDLGAM